MGKAMVNATNLVADVTIVAHLNLKTINTTRRCGPSSPCISLGF
jgi:hypothetical protein